MNEQKNKLQDLYGCEFVPDTREYEVLGMQHYCDFLKTKDKFIFKKDKCKLLGN